VIVPTRRAADGSKVLALPKGHPESGEGPAEAALREVRDALADAGARGVRDAYLLTTTADRWFRRLGFVPVERSALPAALAGSEELKGACPASAVAMHRALAETPGALPRAVPF